MTPRPLSRDAFAEPSRDYGILPFWFLNGELDPDEMRFQLAELRDKKMQGVVFHGRYGLEMDYLGDRYLERIRLGAEEAERLGLVAWIYDEMNWPSGTADKRVLRAHPDLAQRYLECVTFTVRGPWFMCLTGEDSRYLDFERSTPVAAFAIAEDGRILDLTRNLSFDKVVPWEVPPGDWRLCYIVEKRADYYIDALDPDSTKAFIDLGYAPYADAIGDTFAQRIVGFYSDEPAMHYFLTAQDNAIVPWTKDMFGRFHERNGYELRSRLIDLFFDVRPDSAKVRMDFYRTTTAFYSDAYYRQLREWCNEQGVRFTAHLLYEEWLRNMIRVEGNLFRHYEQMDTVAVDHLYPIIGTRETPDQHVAIKVASSAAHQLGSERLICESFGGIFMDATMQRMKWIADWEMVLGVNVVNPHGFHYTLEGARKRDWPPSMFYQYPWWRYYSAFSEYVSRVQETLTGGRHLAKVAVLWPINSMFATYRPQIRTDDNEQTQAGLNHLTDQLLRLHHDFDYLDEDILARADVADGRVRVGDESYELVIVPPMTHVLGSTVDALERFVEGGGRVLGTIEAPASALSDDGLVDVGERVRALVGDGSVVERGSGRGRFVRGGGGLGLETPEERSAWGRAIDDAIVSLIDPDVRIDDDEIFCLHRTRDDRDVLFVTNPTFEARTTGIRIRAAEMPELWDPTTGRVSRPADASLEDGWASFELALPPVGSVLVVSPVPSSHDGDAAGEDEGGADFDPIALDGAWSFEAEDDNALVLTSWLAAQERADVALETYVGDPDGADWLPVVAGAWSFQLPTEPDTAYPVPVWYRVAFDVDEVPERLALLIDGFDGSDPRMYLNGEPATAEPVRSRIDAQMRELDLTSIVRAGSNVLAIRVEVTGPTGGIVDHLKIVGAFALERRGDGYVVVAPKTSAEPRSWTEQGYPFFSGRGVYRRTVEVPEAVAGALVALEIAMIDDVVEVEINGESAGVRIWDPYVVEVTGRLRAGENEIALRVANTPANLLNAVERPSGIAGPPRLVPSSAAARVATTAAEAR
jgi:hypothetical protein